MRLYEIEEVEDWEEDLPYQVRRRDDSGSFTLRFSIKGFGQQRYGLGTKDKREAHAKARTIYYRALGEAEAGTLGGQKTFGRFADEYSKLVNEQAQAKPEKLADARKTESIIERYLNPALGKKSINAITVADLNAYLLWRKDYWITGDGKDVEWISYMRGGKKVIRKPVRKVPSHATLKREAHTLRCIFKYAADFGFIRPADIPSARLGKEEINKRPHFTKKDMKKLISIGVQRVIEAPSAETRYERELLNSFIMIAVNTGLRPTEMYNLRWGNVEGLEDRLHGDPAEKSVIKITAHGKGKGPQQMIPKQNIASSFAKLLDLFHQVHKREPKKTDPVFCNKNGERLKSIRKGLNALLEAADLRTDADGRNYSAYCFRHTYATWARQKSPPVDVYTLAINMRTSVRMIEQHYGKAQSADQVEILGEEDEW